MTDNILGFYPILINVAVLRNLNYTVQALFFRQSPTLPHTYFFLALQRFFFSSKGTLSNELEMLQRRNVRVAKRMKSVTYAGQSMVNYLTTVIADMQITPMAVLRPSLGKIHSLYFHFLAITVVGA